MKRMELIMSNDAPGSRDVAWLKPVKGGFALKIMDGGVWKDLKIESEEEHEVTTESLEKLKSELIGSVQDKKTANTINGAKALTKELQKKVGALEAKNSEV